MTGRHHDDDDLDDASEGADQCWDDEDDDTTVPCPHCGRDVFDDAERCPHCGLYLTREDAPPRRRPWWIILGAIACLYAVFRWTVR